MFYIYISNKNKRMLITNKFGTFHVTAYTDVDPNESGVQIYEISSGNLIETIPDLHLPDEEDLEAVITFNHEIEGMLELQF